MVITLLPVLSINYLFSNDGYTKRMLTKSGDNEILNFIQSESSMSVRYLELLGEGTTLIYIRNIKISCPWIKITKMKLSATMSGKHIIGEVLCQLFTEMFVTFNIDIHRFFRRYRVYRWLINPSSPLGFK